MTRQHISRFGRTTGKGDIREFADSPPQRHPKCCPEFNGAAYREEGVLVCRYCQKPCVDQNPKSFELR